MAVILALLEGGSIFATVGAMIFVRVYAPPIDWINMAAVLEQALALSLCFVAAFYYTDLYELRIVPSFANFVSRLPQSCGVAFLLVVAVYTLFPETKLAANPWLSSLLISTGVTLGLVLPLRAVCYGIMRSGPFRERVLILGTSPLAHKLIGEIEARPHCRYAIVGVADDTVDSAEVPFGYPLLGPLERLDRIIQEVRPKRIIVALADRRGQLPVHQLLESRVRRGIIVEDGVDVYERLTGKLAIEWLAPSSLIYCGDFRKSRLALAIQHGVSLLVAAVGLVSLAPVLGLIALAIKLDSSGPAFFVQNRVGLYGKSFRLLKFRTMHPVGRQTSEWVQDNRDRITRVGKWVRKFRLDELPQLVNILRGDMNLVGPRPHPVSNFELFSEKIPYYSLRSVVRPGLTGWAQIRYGYANNLQEETEKMRFDLYYVKHMSFWLDLRILFDTTKVLLSGRGSMAAEPDQTDLALGVKGHLRAGSTRRAA